MPTERFTLDEFENAIEESCNELDLYHHGSIYDAGEYCWSISFDPKVFVSIRSSIGSDFIAKDTGEDSIRLVLYGYTDGVLGKNSAKWITRVPGWDKRLKSAIKDLYELRKKAGDCPICNRPLRIHKVKKEGANKGRLFACCINKNHNNAWKWLTEVKK